jgi:ATP-binding cassette subfamily B (MDR/TAP) protein 1
VLKGVTFTASPGEVVALVGPSGAGKSTIVALIERFYNCDAGSIEINGTPLDEIDYHWLHRNVALVSQEPVLFGCSIRDNIQ